MCCRAQETGQGLPDELGWCPCDAQDCDYVMHPCWRIVGTMNVYDKSSLYAMSFAFMRRFAFVDVDLPSPTTYSRLVDTWLRQHGLQGAAGPEDASQKTLRERLQALLEGRPSVDAAPCDRSRHREGHDQLHR